MDNKRENILQRTMIICLGAMLCCILWGSSSPCIKLGYELFCIRAEDTATQILFAGIRFALAGILTIIIGSVFARKLLYPKRYAWFRVLKLSCLQTVLQYFFFYVGLAHTTGVKASIIIALNVFVAILVSSLVYHQERLTLSKMVGCILGFLGVILINMNGMNFRVSFAGEGFILCSTVAYAFSSVYIKCYSAMDSPVMLSGYQFLIGGGIMILIGKIMGGYSLKLTCGGGMVLLYLAVVSAVAYSVWGLLLKYNPVSKVAVFGFMNPVCGVILSALLLGEEPLASGWSGFTAIICVCTGIYVLNREK